MVFGFGRKTKLMTIKDRSFSVTLWVVVEIIYRRVISRWQWLIQLYVDLVSDQLSAECGSFLNRQSHRNLLHVASATVINQQLVLLETNYGEERENILYNRRSRMLMIFWSVWFSLITNNIIIPLFYDRHTPEWLTLVVGWLVSHKITFIAYGFLHKSSSILIEWTSEKFWCSFVAFSPLSHRKPRVFHFYI